MNQSHELDHWKIVLLHSISEDLISISRCIKELEQRQRSVEAAFERIAQIQNGEILL